MYTIGIIGIRGFNVIYSGFETFVKYLIYKTNNKKILYYLFCRNIYQTNKPRSKKFRLIIVPVLNNKYLETLLYGFFSNIHSLFIQELDIILYLGVANTLFIFLQKLFRRKVLVNVDGIDWQRKRWSQLGRVYLKICERLSVRFADVLICDSKVIMNYYRNKYSVKNIVYIPYGAQVKTRGPGKVLRSYELTPNEYFLFVGRLVPENSAEDLILAFRQIETKYKCVIVGDSVHEDAYKKLLLHMAKGDNRIVFTGFLIGKAYEEICSNSFAYIETKSIGGTHPSLLEAMAFRNCVIAKNIREHKEVLGNSGLYYNKKRGYTDLQKKLSFILTHKSLAKKFRESARARVKRLYGWSTVLNQYKNLFSRIAPKN